MGRARRDRSEFDLLPNVVHKRLWLVDDAPHEAVGFQAVVGGVVLHGGLVEELVEGASATPPERPVAPHGKGPTEPGAVARRYRVSTSWRRDGEAKRCVHIDHRGRGAV